MEAKVASSEDFPMKIANIQFAIVAINALSKVCAPLFNIVQIEIFPYVRFVSWYFDFFPSSGLVLTLSFEIQGFSERLVTGSRPRIGLMFKQVCTEDVFSPSYESCRSSFAPFNVILLTETSFVACRH